MGLSSKVRHSFDAEPKVMLRDAAAAAVTATKSETGISLDTLKAAYWQGNETPQQTFAAIINVSAVDKTTGDETYVFTIQVDSVLAFSDSPVTIATLTVNAAGVYVVNLDGPTIDALDVNAAFIRVTATLAGTTPILSYGAWLAPAV